MTKNTLHRFTTNITTSTVNDLSNIKMALDESSIVAITNKAGMITYVNEKFCSISQYDERELLGKTHRIINSGFHPKSFFKNMWDTILSKRVWQGEVQNRAKDGSTYWTSTTIVPFLNSNNEIHQFISIRQDITARVKAEEELAKALRNDFQHVVKHMEQGVFKLRKMDDEHIVFTLSEGKLAEQLQLTSEYVFGKTIEEIFPADVLYVIEPHIQQALHGKYSNVEFSFQQRQLALSLSPIRQVDALYEIIGALRDITEQHEYEQKIFNMAHYDTLTNLPNRTLFSKKLTEAIERAQQRHTQLAILFIDLSNFKQIKDSYGHATGDTFLAFIAQKLRHQIRKTDLLARFSGDEFLILVEDVDEAAVKSIGKRLIQSMDTTFELGHLELHTALSIGISMYPKDGSTTNILLQHADNAMHAAKTSGLNRYQLFSAELHTQLQRKYLLETALNDALKKEQLMVYYQPKLAAQTKAIIGAEALIRWQHATEGLISPAEFIPIAEKNGLIIPIGEWILNEAVRQAKLWLMIGNPLTVSVNVSILQITHSNFVEDVRQTLKQHKLPAHLLNLEITESMTTDITFMTTVLHQLKALGVGISIDDFGTGYSSLKYLSQLPIDTVKIDQSFVRDLTIDNQNIIKTIIQLAHSMRLNVVAEGIETAEQELFLVENACHQLQGFHYSKPMPVHLFHEYLTQQVIVK